MRRRAHYRSLALCATKPAGSVSMKPSHLDALADVIRVTDSGAIPERAALRAILDAPEDLDAPLFEAAGRALDRSSGRAVYLRGIVEFCNACRKDCLYCGVRRGNTRVARYAIPFDEIVEALEEGYRVGLRSFLLQSGEALGDAHLALVERVLRWMKARWGDSVRPVLSIGELPRETFRQLREAGGGRYLLRIETSDPELYARLHPQDAHHRFEARVQALHDLRDTGWQVGTGVLIGVPWQTPDHLAGDLLFMRRFDIDMCGMGPYIEHHDTPLWEAREQVPDVATRVRWTLRMIALQRLLLPDTNVSATTALQTIHPQGLELGLGAGANVFMPNLTPWKYRESYDLYEGKVRVADSLDSVLERMSARCAALGRPVALGDPGDPVRFRTRQPPP